MKKSIFVLTAIFTLLFANQANAQVERHQATFVYNFTRLVQWPNLHERPTFVIGILGRNAALLNELNASAADRNVGSRSIEVKEFASIEELEYCHILFVSNSRLRDLARANEKLANMPVLVVTENQGRHPAGSIINLSIENERLGLRLDEELAEQRKLIISRQLANFSR